MQTATAFPIRSGRRQGRTLFLAYLCAAYVAVLLVVPAVSAFEPSSAGGSSARAPSFAQLDRNRDGYVDRNEAAALPGLRATILLADTNRDGRLDQVELAKALALLDATR